MNDSTDNTAPAAAPAIAPERLEQAIGIVRRMREEIGRAVVGQEAVLDQVLACCLAGGHVLIEGVPGLGKTLLVKALAKTFAGEFSRIQFTPDLMPADVMGHAVFDMKNQSFSIRKGPVFTHLLLADEINRAPAKTQSALLEVMQERQVTIEGESHLLAAPFMVLATQNPLENEGTYPLPEAQLDRFLVKVRIGYPSADEEEAMLQMVTRDRVGDGLDVDKVATLVKPETIVTLQNLVARIRVDDAVPSMRCGWCAPRATGPALPSAPGRAARSRWCGWRARWRWPPVATSSRRTTSRPPRCRCCGTGWRCRRKANSMACPATSCWRCWSNRWPRRVAERAVMTPAPRLLGALGALAALGVAAGFWPLLLPLAQGCALALAMAAGADALLSRRAPQLRAERMVAGVWPVDAWNGATVELHNEGARALAFELLDDCPPGWLVEGLPHASRVGPGAFAAIGYRLRPQRRGDAHFGAAHVRIASPFGLWRRIHRVGPRQDVKVFPDFSSLLGHTLTATDRRAPTAGAIRKRRRGEGTDFRQLREYRKGDSLRSIDWKATARHQKPISREYQEERDQQVVFLLDTGRRMLAEDDGSTHFDHALNAVLTLASWPRNRATRSAC
jgi:MoxR-like ATPase